MGFGSRTTYLLIICCVFGEQPIDSLICVCGPGLEAQAAYRETLAVGASNCLPESRLLLGLEPIDVRGVI
jgi:hypothetical protein